MKSFMSSLCTFGLILVLLGLSNTSDVSCWVVSTTTRKYNVRQSYVTSTFLPSSPYNRRYSSSPSSLHQSSETKTSEIASPKKKVLEELPYDYEIPEDSVIHIKPRAMVRLRELREQQLKNNKDDNNEYLLLRMGVRSGGCSGMSYVMDFTTADNIDPESDMIDVYEQDKIQCIVDTKSMLYLYGLQLDYSTELIGGGFKFNNPNAEESCGCGSSFGV